LARGWRAYGHRLNVCGASRIRLAGGGIEDTAARQVRQVRSQALMEAQAASYGRGPPPLTAIPLAAGSREHGVGPRASMQTATMRDARRAGAQHGKFLALPHHLCGVQGPGTRHPPVGWDVNHAGAW